MLTTGYSRTTNDFDKDWRAGGKSLTEEVPHWWQVSNCNPQSCKEQFNQFKAYPVTPTSTSKPLNKMVQSTVSKAAADNPCKRSKGPSLQSEIIDWSHQCHLHSRSSAWNHTEGLEQMSHPRRSGFFSVAPCSIILPRKGKLETRWKLSTPFFYNNGFFK